MWHYGLGKEFWYLLVQNGSDEAKNWILLWGRISSQSSTTHNKFLTIIISICQTWVTKADLTIKEIQRSPLGENDWYIFCPIERDYHNRLCPNSYDNPNVISG